MSKIYIDGGSYNGDTVKSFRAHFGNDYFIYAFEPNPFMKQYYTPALNVNFMPFAIWIADERMQFYLGDPESGTVMRQKTTGNLNKSSPIKVNCLDFSYWLQKNFTNKDEIILKLDIEGSEFDVLDQMLVDGTTGLIKELYVDFHHHKLETDHATRDWRERHKKLVAKLNKVNLPPQDITWHKHR